jgi:hypothetical protein
MPPDMAPYGHFFLKAHTERKKSCPILDFSKMTHIIASAIACSTTTAVCNCHKANAF